MCVVTAKCLCYNTVLVRTDGAQGNNARLLEDDACTHANEHATLSDARQGTVASCCKGLPHRCPTAAECSDASEYSGRK
jgi:hypothetical protein